jgi:hypothetical protein
MYCKFWGKTIVTSLKIIWEVGGVGSEDPEITKCSFTSEAQGGLVDWGPGIVVWERPGQGVASALNEVPWTSNNEWVDANRSGFNISMKNWRTVCTVVPSFIPSSTGKSFPYHPLLKCSFSHHPQGRVKSHRPSIAGFVSWWDRRNKGLIAKMLSPWLPATTWVPPFLDSKNCITWFIVLTHLQQICSCICISLPTVQLPFWFHCMLGWCVWIMSWTQLPSGYHPGVQIEWAPCSMHHPLNPWGEQHGHVLFMLLKFNRWTYPMHISSLP